MEKRKRMLILIAIASVITISTVAFAINRDLRFLSPNLDLDQDYSDITESPRQMTYPFTLENLPEYFDAGVEITGSGYTGQLHTVNIWVSHDRPDSSIWFASGNYTLDLELNGDVKEKIIPLGSFTDLRRTARFNSPSYDWIPSSPAAIYNITLSLDNIVWTFGHIIDASAGADGTIDPEGSIIVADGGYQGFFIEANPGYAIFDVLVDGSSVGQDKAYTFNDVIDSFTIHATFIEIHTITATAGSGGSIDPSGEIALLEGSGLGFNIIPDVGYAIDTVLVDNNTVAVTDSPFHYPFLNVQANHTIHATFVLNGAVFSNDEKLINNVYTSTAPHKDFGISQVTFDGDLIHAYNEGEMVSFNMTLERIGTDINIDSWLKVYYEYLDGTVRTLAVSCKGKTILFPDTDTTDTYEGTFTAPAPEIYRIVLVVYQAPPP